MRLELFGSSLGGGCLIGSVAGIIWEALLSTPIMPIASIIACCIGMILGYAVATKVRNDIEHND